jgi:hypothetical protein
VADGVEAMRTVGVVHQIVCPDAVPFAATAGFSFFGEPALLAVLSGWFDGVSDSGRRTQSRRSSRILALAE